MAHMRNQIDLFTKHIVASSGKVNVVGPLNRYKDQDIDLDEEAKYLGNQGGFRIYNSGNQGYNSGNTGRNYSREGQYDRPTNREKGNWQNRDGYINDRCGVYVPPGNRDCTSGSSSGSKLEDMLAKVLQKFESIDAGVKEMKGDFSMNIPLVEALEQIPGYSKFMKDLVTKKRAKKEDPGAFTILCTIKSIVFAKALCDLGVSINLMPLSIYKKIGLGVPKPTTMRLMMADRSVKRPVGILCDVLEKVDTFIFLSDFVILDCEVDFEVPTILGRPFLATGRALVDVESGELKFRLNKEEVKFKICRSMKQPHDMNVVFAIEAFDEGEMRATNEERLEVETLAAMLINFEIDFRTNYVETLNALQGMGERSYAPKKLDLDLKNRPSPPAKLSIEEPFVLELKQLHSHMRYVFFGTNNTLPVILAVYLNYEQVQAVIKVLIRYKRAIGWTIVDIIGIPPGICTHKIQLEKDCNPSIKHQRRLNPPMQEVLKNEIIKWLDVGFVYPISDNHWVSQCNVYPKRVV
ncbi:uncharacterized protein LOC125845709 [Solanum stenotomum]|uniref:uncharacterized protein LOC125845709 n=1 Tax=Solanum stenotomum TaxID=172797 RepID=UPI0020D09DB4|nr:uncharacterized protein LOC125845709 [Solanum stenotomum]